MITPDEIQDLGFEKSDNNTYVGEWNGRLYKIEAALFHYYDIQRQNIMTGEAEPYFLGKLMTVDELKEVLNGE